MRGQSESSSSSGEEDGDAEWRKAISSVAAATSSYITAASAEDGAADNRRDHKPKHYQIKVQKLLDDILEKSLIMVNNNEDNDDNNDTIHGDHDIHVPESDLVANNGGGIRLFKHSTPGLSLDHADEPRRPQKRPKILPGEEIDEKSKKFKQRLRSIAVDGSDVIAAAKNAGEKALARREAKEAAAKEAAKREEERVAELKKTRGERWLPSLAREKCYTTH